MRYHCGAFVRVGRVLFLLLTALVASSQVATSQQKEAEKKKAAEERKLYITITPEGAAAIKKRFVLGTGNKLRIDADRSGFDLKGEFGGGFLGDYQGESQGITIVATDQSAASLPAGLRITQGEKDLEFDVPDPLDNPPDASLRLSEARKDFKSRLNPVEHARRAAPDPPPGAFRKVQFDAPLGKLTAYLSPDPPDRKRRPAILWISGGDNTLNHERWTEGKADDEQSATVFRRAGLMMMCASLRGNEDNPGYREGFWGEVDDILAAGEYLKKHRYVDPKRIYLGGHSTGGTLALLAAECSDQFRAVFCFGPASNVGGYKKDYCPFFLSDPRELELRAPIRWLHSIKSPVFVFEGANAQGTNEALQRMSAASKNKQVQFFSIPGGNHFNVLAPTNFLIADRIVRDSGPKCTIAFTLEELTRTLQAAARK